MNENIIAVNVPNAISILIMAVAGTFILSIALKALHGRRGSNGSREGGG